MRKENNKLTTDQVQNYIEQTEALTGLKSSDKFKQYVQSLEMAQPEDFSNLPSNQTTFKMDFVEYLGLKLKNNPELQYKEPDMTPLQKAKLQQLKAESAIAKAKVEIYDNEFYYLTPLEQAELELLEANAAMAAAKVEDYKKNFNTYLI